jgi:hypothetical protein
MKTWKAVCTGLVTLAGLTSQLPAQPAVPAAAGPPDLASPPSGVAPGGLAQFLGITKDQKEALKRKCCKTPFGQMINNSMAPMRAFTGGILGGFCPQGPSLADLAKPGAEGAANKIKKDEAEAKARRAAVRYLGTVDCHYWPEAQDALIGALRADRNECVRWEAAMALGGGCCCTKKTMEALLISATASDKDGNPSETCERVRAAAYASLQHCLACFSQEVPAEPVKKGPEVPVPEKPAPDKSAEKPTASNDKPENRVLTPYYYELDKKPMAQTIEEGRKACEHFTIGTTPVGVVNASGGHHGLFDIVQTAMNTSKGPMAPVENAQPMPMSTSEPAPMVERTPPLREPTPMRNVAMPAVMTDTTKPVPARPADYRMETPEMPAQSPLRARMKMMLKPPESITPVSASSTTTVTPTAPVTTPAPAPMATPMTTPAPVPMTTPAPLTTPFPKPVAVPMTVPTPAPAPMTTPAPMTAPAPAPMTPNVPTMPVMPAPAAPIHSRAPSGPGTQQLMLVLRNSTYPFQREWAVNELSALDWHGNPEVVQSLLSAAQRDSSPTVRCACVRALAKMKVDTVPVATTLQALKADTDPRVQREATEALSQMRPVETVSAATVNTPTAARPATVVPATWTAPIPRNFSVKPASNAFSQ